MTTSEISTHLRRALYQTGYRYGFYAGGVRHLPDPQKGFDAEFAHLLQTAYRIQNPAVTVREKLGTCVDAVLVMKTILDRLGVPCRIWLLFHRERRREHVILTFFAEDRVVYLELTPQSGKPWYGKELIYPDVRSFLEAWQAEYAVTDVTDRISVGVHFASLLSDLTRSVN